MVWFVIVYDLKSGVSDRNCVYLSNIQVDIMDYIIPASCTDLEFRQMWAEFEWENKVGAAGRKNLPSTGGC
jgi:coatomer subunit beta